METSESPEKSSKKRKLDKVGTSTKEKRKSKSPKNEQKTEKKSEYHAQKKVFQGMQFGITGTLDRSTLTQTLQENGGTVTGVLSKKVFLCKLQLINSR